MATKVEIRREVSIMAQLMEQKLRANDHKVGWKDCDIAYMYRCVEAELHELEAALVMNRPAAILDELVDVLNTGMMLCDKLGLLDAAEKRLTQEPLSREDLGDQADLVDSTKLLILSRLENNRRPVTFRELRTNIPEERLPILEAALKELSDAKMIRIAQWFATSQDGDAFELVPESAEGDET